MEWRSARHLADHFAKHGREVGAATPEEYDVRARALLTRDDTFTFGYEDWTTGERRVRGLS